MKPHDETRLDEAIAAIRNEAPNAREVQAAGERVWARIQAACTEMAQIETIQGCSGFRALMPAWRAGTLTPARKLLLEDHLKECVACRHFADEGREAAQVKWNPAFETATTRTWGMQRIAYLAVLLVVAATATFVANRYLLTAPEGYRARLEQATGTVYRVTATGETPLSVGSEIGEGQLLRTAAGAHAFVRLRDGSRVEISDRAEIAVAMSRKDSTINLDRGQIIVEAAHRSSGHLYVRTDDCRVAVTGTVFSVNSGTKGSRVAVIQGAVRVTQAGGDQTLHPGDEVATNASMGTVPVRDEIAWSQELDKHLALLAQFASLEKKFEQIPTPAPRFNSRILQAVPPTTVVYVSLPNLADILGQAKQILDAQMQESDVLRQWWHQANNDNSGPTPDQLIEKIRATSEYLGDEVVFFAAQDATGKVTAPVLMADVRRSGLREFLESQFASDQHMHMTIIDEQQLGAVATTNNGVIVLLRPDMMIAAPDAQTLRAVDQQLNAGNSGFSSTPFGQKIADAYSRGAGVLIAADVQDLARAGLRHARRNEATQFRRTGIPNMQYVLIERREVNGEPMNRAVLAFNGQRTGLASWMAAPAPMGSLEFVSPNAALVVAGVSKSPASMFDDLMQIVAAGSPTAPQEIREKEAELDINLRQDLAATLGGDFAVALDGPVLPVPAWKLVVEVYDPVRLQNSIQQLIQAANQDAAAHGRPTFALQQSNMDGQTIYTIKWSGTPVFNELDYAYVDGYMVTAPTRALLLDTIATHRSGSTLVRSSAFQSMLPRDQQVNFSALLYQNLAPVLQPLAGYVNDNQLAMLKQIAADSRPTVVTAYGAADRIEVASTSKFFGFDLNTLTLSTLLGRNNHGTSQAVTP